MLLLTFTSLRTAAVHQDVAELVLRGDIPSALRIGTERFERLAGDTDAQARASLGQLLGRCMLACGREEEAEEMFQRLLKIYESISRPMVRWQASLDQGTLLLRLNRPGRAVECFSTVADDHRAPAELRIEAMASAAVAMHRSGEGRTALQALDVARRLGDAVAERRVAQLVDCVALELCALQLERTSDALEDHALGAVYRESTGAMPSHDVLCQQLGAAAAAFAASMPLVAHRMQHLQSLLGRNSNGVNAAAQVGEALTWLRDRRLAGFEVETRVEAARLLIGRDALHAAGELIAPLAFNEQQVQRSRYALELAYCMARLHQHQGRPQEALRLYRQHTHHAVLSFKSDTSANKRMPRFLDLPQAGLAATAPTSDTAKMRLPLRYRRAYQYIIDHLADEHLSVRQVAAHVDVTERALQLAFRTHLGMTPAELIRTRRMERIRDELRDDSRGRSGVREVASRWGITNRSTLISNYRSRFDETPSQTRRGQAEG
jgi:AraC-like DNA-binding protein